MAGIRRYIGDISCAEDSSADDFDPQKFNPAQFEEYEKKINAILLTRRDEEKIFVAKVVEQVRLKRIPAKLVDVSYQWAGKNRPQTKYPFIYFERVLRLQAKKLRLEKEIPPFDFSIYGSAGQKIPGQNGTAGQRTDLQKSGTTRSAVNRSSGQIR